MATAGLSLLQVDRPVKSPWRPSVNTPIMPTLRRTHSVVTNGPPSSDTPVMKNDSGRLPSPMPSQAVSSSAAAAAGINR